jgi:DNA replication protein DnaC
MDSISDTLKTFTFDPEESARRYRERVEEQRNAIMVRCASLNGTRRDPEWQDRKLAALGVPKRFIGAKMADFPSKVYCQYLTRWTTGESGFLHGDTGTGKTHFAVALLRAKLEVDEFTYTENEGRFTLVEPKTPKFTTVPQLLQEIRGTFGDNGATDRLIETYQKADCLVLDDLGAEKSSDWSLEILYLIIDSRYSGLRQLLVTSNLEMDAIAARLGDRVASRLSGLGFIIELAGKDRRVSR